MAGEGEKKAVLEMVKSENRVWFDGVRGWMGSSIFSRSDRLTKEANDSDLTACVLLTWVASD